VQKRRDQQPIDVESRMVLARDPDGNRVVIETNRPITERKRMEQTLRERAEQLTNDDRAKNEFLAMLGHELRNPLAPLRNAAEILKQSSTKEPILASVRDMIMRQVNAMARMVDDLLDVARITGHTLELRRSVVDLGSVIKHSVEMAQPEFERRDQKLSVALPQEPIYVDGDAVRLEQIFDNLLLNASKFSPSTGQISLSMQRPASAEAGGSTPRFATVTLRDNGEGITPEVLPRIFDLFVQGEQALDRARGGLGIGLTLVKQLVELHGGKVTVYSAGRGRGSEFTVHLPIVMPKTPVATLTSEASQAPRHSKPRKILIVDDNVDSAVSLRMLLELEGHEVAVAAEGNAGLQTAAQFHPKVVLLDIGLPGMDGYEIARRLRNDHERDGAWLIAVSGYGQEAHRLAAQQAGFDRYMVKPVDFDAFREVLDSLPARRQ
jgi:signal transduction histidine kinase/ActR/RegA family two-component response regulator